VSDGIDALEALLQGRRSVRAFTDAPVSPALVERILRAAVLAPSASNKQPWRFFVMDDAVRIRSLADAVRAEKERIATHIGEGFKESFLAYGDYFTRFERAPIVIAPAARSLTILSNLVDDALDADTRSMIRKMEDDSGLIGTSLALGNMLLAAHALGLGASAMTGPLIARGAVDAAFGVPSGWSVVALLALGYPSEAPAPTDRKDAAKVTRYVR
jgi:nitroreductase